MSVVLNNWLVKNWSKQMLIYYTHYVAFTSFDYIWKQIEIMVFTKKKFLKNKLIIPVLNFNLNKNINWIDWKRKL